MLAKVCLNWYVVEIALINELDCNMYSTDDT